MRTIGRRNFLKAGGMAGAAIGLPTIIPSTVLGASPNGRVGVGKISCGGRSSYANRYQRYSRSQIVAVCDPISSRRLRDKKRFGNCPDYNDFRELLANKDVDAVHISTADHWHVPIAIMAAKAGKDMYVEKPLGISINHDLKSRVIVDKYKRLVQYGAQQRSILHVRLGIQLVLNGHIGDVKEAYVWCPHGHSGGSATPVLPIPDGYDYNMWLGPAPEAPFCKDRAIPTGARNGIFHIYDYAIGFMAGWGAHPMDMLQWWADNAGMKTIPTRYEATGTLPTKGLFNTVTNWDAKCTYENGLKMRFMDDITARKVKPHPGVYGGHGTLFVGSKGWVTVSRGGWKVSSEEIRRKAKDPGDKRLVVSRDQIQNLVDCVISREQPVDDLHSAVRSDIICHLTDICVRRGRPITWDLEKETIVGDAEAVKMMSRPLREPWTL
ncbi:MAG: Gfo/Idh/MocA family protein [Planctomycetota bacterium]|jgi:predicted dehydrogenase